MADRSAYLEGANIGLAAAIAITVAGGGLLLVGPGSGRLQSARAELGERLAALDAWESERSKHEAAAADERARWTASWEALHQRAQPVANDAELVARVSDALGAPTVRNMQVARTATAGQWAEDAEESPTLSVQSPVDGHQLALHPVQLQARFHAAFEDASEILGRFEARRFPARLEALTMRRDYPGVEVAVDFTWFVREDGQR